jgi:hypothetical protein
LDHSETDDITPSGLAFQSGRRSKEQHMADVVDIICYPVKGCAGTSMRDAFLTPAGLSHDRSFMVVSEDGVHRTQRRHPRLALIRPAVSADGSRLTLDSADTTGRYGTVCLNVTTSAPRRDVDLFGAAFQGSTRVTKPLPGSRRSSAPPAAWSACPRSTTGSPTA